MSLEGKKFMVVLLHFLHSTPVLLNHHPDAGKLLTGIISRLLLILDLFKRFLELPVLMLKVLSLL